MSNNKKPSPAGATAPAQRQLLPALRSPQCGMPTSGFPPLPVIGAAGTHAYGDSQVIFFGHDLPQDYNRRR